MAADWNTRLPRGWFAEPNVPFGVEIEMAAFEEMPAIPPFLRNGPWMQIDLENTCLSSCRDLKLDLVNG